MPGANLEDSLPLKPYAVLGQAQLFLGDSIEIMNSLPPKSVNLIFADPPYNLSNDGYTVHAGKRVSVNKGEWDRSAGVWGFQLSLSLDQGMQKSLGGRWDDLDLRYLPQYLCLWLCLATTRF